VVNQRPNPNDPANNSRPSFGTTHWSLVQAARERGTPEADQALASLCSRYWYPLYAFIRRRGNNHDRAADLTQEFFAKLVEKSYLRAADRDRGRFRSFLLAACTHFLANEHDRAIAVKRGGGRRHVSIDLRDAEGRYLAEPSHDVSAERLFERRWALTLLDQALDQLGHEFRQKGKGALYDRLKVTLTGADAGFSYAEVGATVGMTQAAVKKAAQRLRERYRAILRERIAETVDDPAQVDDEIRTLFSVLAS
jgi:RNA polymerase sigma-70 factor (ECF subfamily)